MDTGPKQRRRMNPRYKANLLSILSFGWTIETFKMGYSRDITDSDLYAALPEHQSNLLEVKESNNLGDEIEKAWNKEVQDCNYPDGNKKPSLNKVLIKVFGAELMISGLIVAAMEFLIRLLQPLFLGLLLRYYNARVPLDSSSREKPVNGTYVLRMMHYYDMEGGVTWGEAVFFSFGIVFCSMANVMVQHPFMMGGMHIGMKIRVGVCSLIYRKALRISSQAMSESSAGLVVNLMANDVNRFDNGPIFMHYLWIGPVETIIMTAYLYRLMGSPAIYSSFVIFAVVPFQIFLGNRTAYYRLQTAIKSDERVRLMKEIITGIEVIKMYTWEKPFRKIIDYSRREEIFYIKRTSYIRGIIMSFIMFTSRFGIFLATLLYVSYYNKVTAETVFFLTCYYNIMKQTMTLYFPQAVGQVAEMLVAISRIREYLLSEECSFPSREVANEGQEDEDVHDARKRVTIKTDPAILARGNASMYDESGSSSDHRPIIKDKHIDDTRQVSILFEDASSGWIKSQPNDVKNINLQIMLGSLTTIIGAVGSGKSTILHMILSELPCSSGSIRKDGVLSYASQEPWLFVGSVRQNILFGQPFNKYRYMEVCKVCALERDISLFPHGDKTVVGERGVSLSGGQRARINLARAVYKIADIYLLDDPLSAVDTQVAKHIFEKCLKRYLGNKTVVLVTHQLQFIKFVDHIVVMENGRILAEGDYPYINKKKLPIIRLMEDNAREVKEEEATSHTGVAVPARLPSMIQQSTGSLYRSLWAMMLDSDALDEKPEAEAQALGRVGGFIYKEYFLAGGIYPFVLFVGFMFVLAQTCCSSGDYWISRWSNIEEQLTGDDTIDNIIWQEYGLQRHHFTIIFTFITACTVCFSLVRSFMFFTLCMKSSINMHDEMFECVSRSPMSFFHVNPSGRILNRFSKDMGAVDELLPQAMLDCFQITLNLIGVLVVILLIDITLIIPTATCIIIFYILRVIYIRTTGAVKRLEGITRSPVFGHLNATVLGLATIRSFGAEALLVEEFDRHQDLHSAAWYLFICCSRAFGYFLDVICLMFIICVTFTFLMKSDVEGSKVGLAITQSISLTGIFQWGMRQSAEMENQMTSVERVLEYTNLAQEDCLRKDGMKKKLENWPMFGEIEFRNVYMKYAPDGDYVLQKLNFMVMPRQKIGIVGRTGAGKSSIIQALFRLAEISGSGSILVDGIDISTIGLHDLREKLAIIPQEPVLFSGTMRKNLDPFDEYSDALLLKALGAVEIISEDENPSEYLYKHVAEGGSNFSVGERQLVCLARAIVRNNKVLILDEATANVDVQTDNLIQNTIRRHFKTCTVLTIAHRLNTIIDSDMILVLDAGQLMEYDHPHILLSDKKGYFFKMVGETGKYMSALLRRQAEESYKLLQGED